MLVNQGFKQGHSDQLKKTRARLCLPKKNVEGPEPLPFLGRKPESEPDFLRSKGEWMNRE